MIPANRESRLRDAIKADAAAFLAVSMRDGVTRAEVEEARAVWAAANAKAHEEYRRIAKPTTGKDKPR